MIPIRIIIITLITYGQGAFNFAAVEELEDYLSLVQLTQLSDVHRSQQRYHGQEQSTVGDDAVDDPGDYQPSDYLNNPGSGNLFDKVKEIGGHWMSHMAKKIKSGHKKGSKAASKMKAKMQQLNQKRKDTVLKASQDLVDKQNNFERNIHEAFFSPSTFDEYPEKFYHMGVTDDWKNWYDSLMQVYPPSDGNERGYEIQNYGLSGLLQTCAANVPAGGSSHTLPFNHTAGANMYALLATQSPVNLADARVLDISAGRGGGAALLSDCFCPSMTMGVDVSPKQVEYADKHYARSGKCPMSFLEADALALPFANASFAVVISVQSSHTVPSYRKFATEVLRVLRPGGAFLTADYRYKFGSHVHGMILQDVFKNSPRTTDVTQAVLQSMNENQLVKHFVDTCNADFLSAAAAEKERLQVDMPRYIKESARQGFEKVTGVHWAPADALVHGRPGHLETRQVPDPKSCAAHAGVNHREYFQSGKMVYLMHVIQKPGSKHLSDAAETSFHAGDHEDNEVNDD